MTNGSCMTTTRLSCEHGDRTLHDNSASSMAHGGSLPVLKRPRSAASATLWRWLLASRTSSSFSRWSRCGCSLANAGARCECRMLIAVNVRLQEYFKDSLTDVTSKRLQRLVAHVEGLHRSFKPHKTLSHGDLRLDNMFLLKVRWLPLMCVLAPRQWQSVLAEQHPHSPHAGCWTATGGGARVVVGRDPDRLPDLERVGHCERRDLVLLVEPVARVAGASRVGAALVASHVRHSLTPRDDDGDGDGRRDTATSCCSCTPTMRSPAERRGATRSSARSSTR